MSCGNPHATPCSEVLDHLDEFLDRELDADSMQRLRQHLEECPPCKGQIALALMWQKLVARSCGANAPQQLRTRIMARISEIRIFE